MNRLDLAQDEKVVKRLLKTEEGRQAIRNITGLAAYTEEELAAQNAGRKKVALLMPSHHQPTPETSAAVIAMQAHSRDYCDLIVTPCVSSSVVHWVRNDLIVRLLKSRKEFDYVLFIDDDIAPPPDALAKMLAHGVDIVAGACTVRQDPPLPNFRTYDPVTCDFLTAAEWDDMYGEGGLIKVGAVGTGFMLISKSAIQGIGEYYLGCYHEKRFLGCTPEIADKLEAKRRELVSKSGNAWWFEFLKHPHGEGEYGEDISFCFKANELGIGVYVDTSIRPGHVGRHPYSIADYLAWKPDARIEDQSGRVQFDQPREDSCAG